MNKTKACNYGNLNVDAAVITGRLEHQLLVQYVLWWGYVNYHKHAVDKCLISSLDDAYMRQPTGPLFIRMIVCRMETYFSKISIKIQSFPFKNLE